MNRRSVVALASCVTVACGAWAIYAWTTPSSLPPTEPPTEQRVRNPSATQRPPGPLKYGLDIDFKQGIITIANRDAQRWTNVRAEVQDGEGVFLCPVADAVEPNARLRIVIFECRSGEGAPERAWSVGVMANEGGIATGIEPAAPAR